MGKQDTRARKDRAGASRWISDPASSAAIEAPRAYCVPGGGRLPEDLAAGLLKAGWREGKAESAAAAVLPERGVEPGVEVLLREHPNIAGAVVLAAREARVDGRVFYVPQDYPAAWTALVLETVYNYALMDRRVQREKNKAEEAVRHVSTLLSTRDEFFSIATHDLRNPITTLRLSLDLLNLPRTEENRQTVDIMRRNLEKMEALIDDMLDVFRLYRGSFSLRLSPVQINMIVEDGVVTHYPQAVEKDIALDFLLDDRCEEVEADPFRVNQVVSNLLSNAIKYTPQGGMVEVRTMCKGEGVLLSVRDSGPGIVKEEQERIFESFSRGSAVATGNEASTGLGLFICRKIMELHGGRIWVESEPGEGSTFSALFPRTAPKRNPQQ